MATKKQTNKSAAKPALKKPDMSAINAVRNPNIDAALAEQNYKNNIAQSLADYQAQNYTMRNISPEKMTFLGQGTLAPNGGAGVLTGGLGQRLPPMNGGLGYSTYEEAGIPPEQAKILDSEMAKMRKDIAAQDAEWENMKKSGKFVPIGQSMAGPIYGTMAGPALSNGIAINTRKPQFNPAQNARNIQGAFDQYAQSMPQNLAMNQIADYNKMLQQGMQSASAMNQDAATNFANMQAGEPITQPATSVIARPTMPEAGLGMRKSQVRPTRTFVPTKAF